MPRTFDRRVLPEPVLDLVRALQRRATSHLAGGAALGGLYLSHRLSADVDLFCHDGELVRSMVRELPDVARDFPTSPLPRMLVALSREEVTRFRDDLAERFRRVALP